MHRGGIADTTCSPGGGNADTTSDPRGGNPDTNIAGAPPTPAAQVPARTSTPIPSRGGNSTEDGPSAGEMRPIKCARFEVAPQYGIPTPLWWECQHDPIDKTSDARLAEYLIGHNVNVIFPKSYWPKDAWQWRGQIYDTRSDPKTFGNEKCVKVLLDANPKNKTRQQAVIPISYNTKVHKRDTSIRKALRECYPDAVTCKDLTITESSAAKTVKPGVRQSVREASETALFASSMSRPSIKASTIPIRNRTPMSALLTVACLTMVNSQQYEHGYVSELAPIEPKTQREARASPQAFKWKEAERIELKTIWDMGTFLIVDRPKHEPTG